ncbi:MAG TPA: energy transducer TonB [Candidatus Solibacter sp.]|nr:energy transducer TonB [Candidatus Solibacter sp.]
MKFRAVLSLLLISLTTFSAAQAAPERVRVARGIESGLLQTKVAPIYPQLARQARIQGTVILKAFINKNGDVADLQLISGHPMLAPAAIEAVRQWKYRPYTLNGEPVDVETEIQINFTLSGDPPAAYGTRGDVPDNGEEIFGGFASVHVPEGLMRSQRTEKVEPAYPPLALQARIEGSVLLVIQVSSSGEVNKISLVSGHPMLAPAAIEAVKQWRYTPYAVNGEPTEIATTARLNFAISPSGSGIITDAYVDPGAVTGVIASTPPSGTRLPQRIRVSQGVSQGLLISRVSPHYPAEAREQHIQGVVVLQVRIDREGNVADIQLISGHPDLAPSAMEAVTQWKYRPYQLNNNPIEMETQVTVNFTLSN